MRRFTTGTTDQYIYFVAVDSTDLTTRETGLSSFTVYRARNGAAATAYTTPTIAEVSSSNMPGVYSLLLDEDMTIGTGNKSEEVVLHITQASMAPVTLVYELYRPDVTDGETITTSGGKAQANVVDVSGAGQTAILAAAYEGSETFQDFLRIARSALAGKASGLATTTANFRDAADTKNRISATVDANGNRSAVTVDPT